MAEKDLPTPDTLRQLLSYDPETGFLTWLPRPVEMFKSQGRCDRWNNRYAGTPALNSLNNVGYRHGTLLGEDKLAHRVIWAMQTGAWPDKIDHENGVRHENWWGNLRNVDFAGNQKNLGLRSDNRSGAIGVSWGAARKRWNAFITVKGRAVNLGSFLTIEEAIAARQKASVEHGYHRNHGARSNSKVNTV